MEKSWNCCQTQRDRGKKKLGVVTSSPDNKLIHSRAISPVKMSEHEKIHPLIWKYDEISHKTLIIFVRASDQSIIDRQGIPMQIFPAWNVAPTEFSSLRNSRRVAPRYAPLSSKKFHTTHCKTADNNRRWNPVQIPQESHLFRLAFSVANGCHNLERNPVVV